MLFLPAKRSAGSQGLRAKNTLFEAKWRKGRFFPKQPVGLDLDGQAERANFASFFEFLNHQSVSKVLKYIYKSSQLLSGQKTINPFRINQ